MGMYDNVPKTPVEKNDALDALKKGWDIGQAAADETEDRTTGYFIENKTAEDRIMSNVANGNLPLAVTSIATGMFKGELCSPDQMKTITKDEKQRYDGVPLLQLAQSAIEKTMTAVNGEDYKFGESATKWVKRADTTTKALLTGGGSVAVDMAVQAAWDVKDGIHCNSENKPQVPETPALKNQESVAHSADDSFGFPAAKSDPDVVSVFKAPADKPISMGIPETPAQSAGLVDTYEKPQAPRRERTVAMEHTGPSM